MLAIALQATLSMSRIQLFEEHPLEVSRQHAHGQEEAGFAGHPSGSIGGQSAAGDDAMQMGVMGQGRTPGMEYGDKSQACTQAFGIGGDGEQGRGGGLKQQVVDHLKQQVVDHRLVLIGDIADGGG